MPAPRTSRRRSGQIAIFLLMALVVLAFTVLWTIDIRRIVFMKGKSQDAGDAAALAAARWQASTLNLIGEANLLRAIAISAGNDAADDALANMQARLCFTGPMAAFAASQQGAKLNGVYAQEELFDDDGLPLTFPAFVRWRARIVEIYARFPDRCPPPYDGAWDDYAGMLNALVNDGIAASANYLPEGTDEGHILYLRAFYDAIRSIPPRWCWFARNYPDLLADYTDHEFWRPLPEPELRANAEFFPLSLAPVPLVLDRIVTTDALETLANEALDPDARPAIISTQATQTVHFWYTYDPARWTDWAIMSADDFPIAGPVLPHYDYTGADSVVSVDTAVSRMTPGLDGSTRRDTVIGSAAAKPFGYLETDSDHVRPDAWSLVLPAFRDIRLIPMDAASCGSNGADDIDWLVHKYGHLQTYVDTGLTASGCVYCAQLDIWDQDGHPFQRDGILWLSTHSCEEPPPGGGGGGGGRGGGIRRGH